MSGQISPVVDGFTYNNFLRCEPYRIYTAQLAQMDILRRANNYRPHWYIAPDNLNDPVPAYETFEFQLRITPRSYLWGIQFMAFLPDDVEQPYVPTWGGNVLVNITEACNGVSLFSEFATASGLQGPQQRGNVNQAINPTLLMQPRLILEPGLLNIEISNKEATAQYCQLTLMFAEPCEVVRD